MENSLFSKFRWLNEPHHSTVGENTIEFTTIPETDFWQRTHYGLQKADGQAFLTDIDDDFTFSIRCDFDYKSLFDQCGLLLWIDSDNWAKASLECGDKDGAPGALGSIVTLNGFSDWASTPMINFPQHLYFRISRRKSDFRFDYSLDGAAFIQMRIFHMNKATHHVQVGIYACSPRNSSFNARFSDIVIEASKWMPE